MKRFVHTVCLASVCLLATLFVGRQCLAFQAPPESGQASSVVDDSFSPQGPYFGRLVIPDIVRYRDLPLRMHLEPTFFPPDQVNAIDDRMVPLFERSLREASDLEVQTVAAMSLARVATYPGLSIESAGAQILQTLKTSKSPSVLYAAALAAANGNQSDAAPLLVELARQGNDAQRAVVEPALIRWKAASAKDLWLPRLTDSSCSEISFRFAAEGVAALEERSSVQGLKEAVINQAFPFSKRMAASKAIAVLDPAGGSELADLFLKGTERDRLLSVALLDSVESNGWPRAASLCSDPSDAVASNAWNLVLERNPELLLPHLSIGRVHRDSNVRIAAARAMKLFPTAERSAWLNAMLDDTHIQVRNVARQMLVVVGLEQDELYDQIVAEAVENLELENKSWQGIEQSLVLLGQLRATQYSGKCYPLMDYPRDEVSTSAAWLIHMFPDDAFRLELLAYIQKTEKDILDPAETKSDSVLKQQHLLQAAALLRIQEIMPLLEPKFSKAAPGGLYERAAAMWAIGMLMERNPDPSVVKKLEGRIQDRSSIPPEWEAVRRTCVMALGLMRAKSSVKVVQEAYEIDNSPTLIPATARFVLPILGEPMPNELPPLIQNIGGWKIIPPGP